jgi:hypothetical protein
MLIPWQTFPCTPSAVMYQAEGIAAFKNATNVNAFLNNDNLSCASL